MIFLSMQDSFIEVMDLVGAQNLLHFYVGCSQKLSVWAIDCSYGCSFSVLLAICFQNTYMLFFILFRSGLNFAGC